MLRSGSSGSCGACRRCGCVGADLRKRPCETIGHSPRWRAAMRAGSRLQEMVIDVDSLASNEIMLSVLQATSLSSAKHLSRQSVRKISNSVVLLAEESLAIDVSRRTDAKAGREQTGTSRTSFQYGMIEVWSVDTACKSKFCHLMHWCARGSEQRLDLQCMIRR